MADRGKCSEACTTETQMQDREQESIAVVDYEDPSTTEAIEAYDARTGERLDSEEVRKGRAKEVRELDEFEVKMEVDESEMRMTPGKKIWSKWVETQKDPNSPAIRCRLCATEVNTGESRSDTFAATPLFENSCDCFFDMGSELQAQAAIASMSNVIHVVPPKDLRKKGRSGDCSRVSTELVTQVKCLRGTWRKDSTIMASREMRWCRVCTGAQRWKHLCALGRRFHLQHSR